MNPIIEPADFSLPQFNLSIDDPPTQLMYNTILAAIHHPTFVCIIESHPQHVSYNEDCFTTTLRLIPVGTDESEWAKSGLRCYGNPLVHTNGEVIATWRRVPSTPTLSSSNRGVFEFWDVKDGHSAYSFIETNEDDLKGIVLTKHFLVGWSSGAVDTWEIASGMHLHRIVATGGGLLDVKVTADERLVAMEFDDGRLRVVDVVAARCDEFRTEGENGCWVVYIDEVDGEGDSGDWGLKKPKVSYIV